MSPFVGFELGPESRVGELYDGRSLAYQMVDLTPYGDVPISFAELDADPDSDPYDPANLVEGRTGITVIGDLDWYAGTNPDRRKPLKVRLHSTCDQGDRRGMHICDCGGQLAGALELMTDEAEKGGVGALVYLPDQEARGLEYLRDNIEDETLAWLEKQFDLDLRTAPTVKAMINQLMTKRLADAANIDDVIARIKDKDSIDKQKQVSTFQACDFLRLPHDRRGFRRAGHALLDLFERYDLPAEMEIIGNNETKREAMEDIGFDVAQIPLVRDVRPENIVYLESKKEQAGHLFGEDLRDQLDVHDGSDRFPLPALNVYQGTALFVVPLHEKKGWHLFSTLRNRPRSFPKIHGPIFAGDEIVPFKWRPEMAAMIDQARDAREKLRQIIQDERRAREQLTSGA
jgi:GTP cyclohydrolase II